MESRLEWIQRRLLFVLVSAYLLRSFRAAGPGVHLEIARSETKRSGKVVRKSGEGGMQAAGHPFWHALRSLHLLAAGLRLIHWAASTSLPFAHRSQRERLMPKTWSPGEDSLRSYGRGLARARPARSAPPIRALRHDSEVIGRVHGCACYHHIRHVACVRPVCRHRCCIIPAQEISGCPRNRTGLAAQANRWHAGRLIRGSREIRGVGGREQ